MNTPTEDLRLSHSIATAQAEGGGVVVHAAVLNFTVALAGVPEQDAQRLYATIRGCIVAILPPVE